MAEQPIRVRGLLVAGAALALFGLAACGGSGGSPSPSSSAPRTSASGGSTATEAPKVARIGVLAATRGPLVSNGKGVRDSVELAVREANTTQAVPGWVFDAVPADDSSTQSGGQQAASGLAANDRMIGVVGSIRSTIDEGMQPILNNAGVALVSPGGTAATLTRRLDGGTTVRPFPTYFRLSATDADQGVAAARYAKSTVKADRVAVVSDGTSYGRLLASTFAAEAKRLGLKRPVERTLVVDDSTAATAVAAADTRRVAVAAAIRKAKADVVFFGGTSAAAAAFAQVLQVERVTAPLMGGDALLGGRFLADLGALAAASDLAVFPGAPADAMPTAREYLRRYRAQGFGTDPGPYGANAYDAARAIIRAFGTSVGDATNVDKDVRQGVVAALDVIDFEGATGPVSFDRFGDAEVRPLAIYEVVGRAWEVAGVVRVG